MVFSIQSFFLCLLDRRVYGVDEKAKSSFRILTETTCSIKYSFCFSFRLFDTECFCH